MPPRRLLRKLHPFGRCPHDLRPVKPWRGYLCGSCPSCGCVWVPCMHHGIQDVDLLRYGATCPRRPKLPPRHPLDPNTIRSLRYMQRK